jgi:hypothetical protein
MRALSARICAVLTLALSGCAGSVRGDDSECPEALAEGGATDGIDLTAPDWLPGGFPLPDDLSIRHLNDQTESGLQVLTGFVPGGDQAAIVSALRRELEVDGFEMLLAAEGFVPVSNVAFVALSEELGFSVMVDVTGEELPVRGDDGECPWTEGVLVGFRFEQADAIEARARYDDSSLTRGSARATIGDQDFAAEGECFVHEGAYRFAATAGDGIALDLWTSETGFDGIAQVLDSAEADFTLGIVDVPAPEPTFRVLPDGWFAEGTFFDAVGDLDPQEGRIDVVCD